MATIKNSYQGQLRTAATHLRSGNEIITDAPVDNQGKGEAFSPTDLVAGALSACMMTIMGIKAQQYDFDLDGLESEVTKLMADKPRKISEIIINFTWPNCPASDEQRAIIKRAAMTCPVALSLHPDVKQTVTFDF